MIRFEKIFIVLIMMLISTDALAVDSYRYLHVTIDTPWAIFLFLLPIVLSPFILMAILYWRFAGRKTDDEDASDADASDQNIIRPAEANPGAAASGENKRADDA